MDSSTSDPTPLLNDHSNNATSKQASPRSGGDAASTPAELTAVVDQLLENLQSKFGAVSADMLSKMDDMSRRLDNLEAHINAQAVGEEKPG